MRIALSFFAAALSLTALTATATAATRSELSRADGMRLTLNGRTLNAELVRTPHFLRDPPTEERVYGQRVAGACGTTFRPAREGFVFERRVWPAGARSLSFSFGRDISRRVKWCVVDGQDGADVAFISFIDAEPVKLVAKGRDLSGEWWRLSGHRGEKLQPCLSVRTGRDPQSASGRCFDGLAEREATLAIDFFQERAESYVVGVVARAAAAVRIRLRDGTLRLASIYRRPSGSRVRASYFLLPLPRGSGIVGGRAVDSTGRTIARKRFQAG